MRDGAPRAFRPRPGGPGTSQTAPLLATGDLEELPAARALDLPGRPGVEGLAKAIAASGRCVAARVRGTRARARRATARAGGRRTLSGASQRLIDSHRHGRGTGAGVGGVNASRTTRSPRAPLPFSMSSDSANGPGSRTPRGSRLGTRFGGRGTASLTDSPLGVDERERLHRNGPAVAGLPDCSKEQRLLRPIRRRRRGERNRLAPSSS